MEKKIENAYLIKILYTEFSFLMFSLAENNYHKGTSVSMAELKLFQEDCAQSRWLNTCTC